MPSGALVPSALWRMVACLAGESTVVAPVSSMTVDCTGARVTFQSRPPRRRASAASVVFASLVPVTPYGLRRSWSMIGPAMGADMWCSFGLVPYLGGLHHTMPASHTLSRGVPEVINLPTPRLLAYPGRTTQPEERHVSFQGRNHGLGQQRQAGGPGRPQRPHSRDRDVAL